MAPQSSDGSAAISLPSLNFYPNKNHRETTGGAIKPTSHGFVFFDAAQGLYAYIAVDHGSNGRKLCNEVEGILMGNVFYELNENKKTK